MKNIVLLALGRASGFSGADIGFVWVLLAAWAAVLLAPLAHAADEPIAIAETLVDRLARAEYDAVARGFDATLTAAMPPAKLRSAWEALASQAGAFQRRVRARTAEQGGYTIVLVTCQFERAAVNVRVVLNAAREVAGLFFVPASRGIWRELPRRCRQASRKSQSP